MKPMMSAIRSLNRGCPILFLSFGNRWTEHQLVSSSDYLHRKRPRQETHCWMDVFIPHSLRPASAGRLINFWTASRFPLMWVWDSGAWRRIKSVRPIPLWKTWFDSSAEIADLVIIGRTTEFYHRLRAIGIKTHNTHSVGVVWQEVLHVHVT